MSRKGFLCGINLYPSSPLRGCVNDVEDMLGVMRSKYCFQTDFTRVVCDQRATTQAIKDRLRWLVSGLKPGDVWVFDYSGHGSFIRDRGRQDELLDHTDECLIPVDIDWENKIIIDDDLGDILKLAPKGTRGYVIIDACHSGTISRDIKPPSDNPGLDHYRADRYLAPPFDIAARSAEKEMSVRRIGRGILSGLTQKRGLFSFLAPKRKEITVVPGLNHVLISGCRSTETSADAYISGRFNGALTWALVSTMRELPLDTPLKSLFGRMVDKLKAKNFNQNPQLEGPEELLNRPIFF